MSTRVITIGRGPDNDVVLDYPMISWEDARLVGDAHGTWILEDLGSTNGTSIGHAERRITTRAEVNPDDSMFFGSFKVGENGPRGFAAGTASLLRSADDHRA